MLENYCGIEENDSSGILLINDNKLKNTSLAIGKLLERDGVFVSGTLIIPLGRRNVVIFLSIAMTEGSNNDTNYWVDSGWKLRRTKRSSKKSNTYSIQTVGESSSLPLLTFR